MTVEARGKTQGSPQTAPTMVVLLTQAAFDRMGSEALALGATLHVMDEAGEVRIMGPPAASAPTVAWLSHDVWSSAAHRAFTGALLGSRTLQWVQTSTAGVDAPIFGALMERGIALSTSHGQAVGIAEYVLSEVLNIYQRGDERRAAQAERTWRPLPFREIAGTRWLIIGYGSIGRAIGERARAFGANVTGVRSTSTAPIDGVEIIPHSLIGGQLGAADVVVLATPLNDATRGLADANFMAALRPGAVLVNVSRGQILDETALLKGLATNRPGHAILDVFQTEPLPAASPLWSHPLVRVTAHTAWASDGLARRNDAAFLANLMLFVEGRAPAHITPTSGQGSPCLS